MTAAESLREVLQLIDDGVLVRDISNDGDGAAFIRQAFRIQNVLAKAVELAAPKATSVISEP